MIDLHLHTNHSDGEWSVAELLCKAESLGLECISISDHENVNAYKELNNPSIRNLFSGKIITGVEIKFSYGGYANELLGYGVDIKKINQIEFLKPDVLKRNKFQYFHNYYKAFNDLGFVMSDVKILEAEFLRGSGGVTMIILGDIGNYKENVEISKRLGLDTRKKSQDFYNKENLNPKSKHYIYEKLEDMKTVSDSIRSCGGLVFMAHIMRVKEYGNWKGMLEYARKNNLIDGVEVYYKSPTCGFSDDEIKWLENYCTKHGLLMSAGTDSHYCADELGVDVTFDWLNRKDLHIL